MALVLGASRSLGLLIAEELAQATSLPLPSIDADRADRRIVDAVPVGWPMVVLTPVAWVGVRVRGLAPATTTRAMGPHGPATEPPDATVAQRQPDVSRASRLGRRRV